MSERMTGVRPHHLAFSANQVSGLQTHGRHTRTEMIKRFRGYYERQLQEAMLALSMKDDDLVVETFTGPYAQKNKQEVTDNA